MESEFSQPVDLEMLRTASDGTEEDIKSLIALFYQQISQSIEGLSIAIQNKALMDIQKIGHKAAGSSSVCGAKQLGVLFRKLQYLEELNISFATEVLDAIRTEFDRIHLFLDAQFGPSI
jgi:HPt (histidine-containing phosphotransfer) domain-containing protein